MKRIILILMVAIIAFFSSCQESFAKNDDTKVLMSISDTISVGNCTYYVVDFLQKGNYLDVITFIKTNNFDFPNLSGLEDVKPYVSGVAILIPSDFSNLFCLNGEYYIDFISEDGDHRRCSFWTVFGKHWFVFGPSINKFLVLKK